MEIAAIAQLVRDEFRNPATDSVRTLRSAIGESLAERTIETVRVERPEQALAIVVLQILDEPWGFAISVGLENTNAEILGSFFLPTVHVGFRIESSNVTAAQIAEEVPLEYAELIEFGELIPHRVEKYAEQSTWKYKFPDASPGLLADRIDSLVNIMLPAERSLRSLIGRDCTVHVAGGVYYGPHWGGFGFHISAHSLAFLGSLEASLDVDQYQVASGCAETSV